MNDTPICTTCGGPRADFPRRKTTLCQIEYRDEYKRLVYSKGLKAADARAIIERQVQADLAKFHATGQLQQSVRA